MISEYRVLYYSFWGVYHSPHPLYIMTIDKIILFLFCIVDPLLTLYAKWQFPWINEYNPIFDTFSHNLLYFAIALFVGKAVFGYVYMWMHDAYYKKGNVKYFNVIRGCVGCISVLVVINNAAWIHYMLS